MKCVGLLLSLFPLLMAGCSFDEKESELCFVGDSITFLWDLDYYFPNYHTKKHAVSGATVQDADKWNVSDCEGLPTVFLIGTNNIGFMKSTDVESGWIKEDFTAKYMQLAKKLKASPLIAISILPRNYEGTQDSTTNIYLQSQNEMIEDSLKVSGIDYKFVDVFDYFIKDNYKIREDLFKDGLHPNEEGYEILAYKIQDIL